MDPSSSTFADRAIEQVSRALAARSSRRSFLGKLTAVALGTLGIELLPLGPFDARALGQPAVNCANYKLCGATGYLCSGCIGGPGCPSGCSSGDSAWCAGCLSDDGSVYYNVCYYDCCTNGTPPTCSNACSNDNCVSGLWCPSGVTTYCCSVAVIHGYYI